jgi:hypothetical protein
MNGFGIDEAGIMQMLAFAAYFGRGFVACWSLAMVGLALFAVILGLRELVLRAAVSGVVAWMFALIGCFLQPDFLAPNEGFFVDRVTTVVMVAVALPLWMLVYGLKLLRDRQRKA